MAITMEKGGERRQWCRGVWEREICPNPQTHSHTQREISRISCFKRLLSSPMHRLLAGEHIFDQPSSCFLGETLTRMNPTPCWRCQPR